MKPKKKKSKKSKTSSEKKENKVKYPRLSDLILPPPPIPFENLVKFLKTNEVNEKEFCGQLLASDTLKTFTTDEIRDLLFVFETFDLRNEGFLNYINVHRCLTAIGFDINEARAQKLVSSLAVDSNGVNFNGFLNVITLLQESSRDTKAEILKGYSILTQFETETDPENNPISRGISAETIRKFSKEMEKSGNPLSEKDVLGMISQADKDGDDVINEDEFIDIMLETNLFKF